MVTVYQVENVTRSGSGSGSIIASVRDTASVRASMSGRVTASVSDTYGNAVIP